MKRVIISAALSAAVGTAASFNPLRLGVAPAFISGSDGHEQQKLIDSAPSVAVSAFVSRNATGVRVCNVAFGDSDVPPAAVAFYNASMNTTGWGFLAVSGNAEAVSSPEDGSFAMGCAEGVATYAETIAYWQNYAANEYGPPGPSPALISFMSKQLGWIRSQIAAFKDKRSARQYSDLEATFWQGMSLLMAQFDGLVYAHEKLLPPSANGLSEILLYLLNSVGDLEDLDNIFPNENRNKTLKEMPLKDKLTDCSAFVRVLPDDVLFGHTTWRRYYAMLRTYKLYSYPQGATRANVIQYSSSPGLLQSKDDFAVTPNLAVQETTNSIFNRSLFNLLSPETALTWQRNAIASLFAADGKEWTSLFSLHQSGTYCSQWMVADASKFVPGQPPLPGFLWIAEPIPGYVHSADVTSIMMAANPNISPESGGGPGNGVWPSYNIPFFEDIYEASGYPAMVAKNGPEYSYQNNSRALIFARNSSMANDLLGARALLRYNNYQSDPLAKGDPILGSISSRGDLRQGAPVAFGGVDTKALSFRQCFGQPGMAVIAESGPTHDQEAVFDWRNFTSFAGVTRSMVPDRWDFGTVSIFVQ